MTIKTGKRYNYENLAKRINDIAKKIIYYRYGKANSGEWRSVKLKSLAIRQQVFFIGTKTEITIRGKTAFKIQTSGLSGFITELKMNKSLLTFDTLDELFGVENLIETVKNKKIYYEIRNKAKKELDRLLNAR